MQKASWSKNHIICSQNTKWQRENEWVVDSNTSKRDSITQSEGAVVVYFAGRQSNKTAKAAHSGRFGKWANFSSSPRAPSFLRGTARGRISLPSPRTDRDASRDKTRKPPEPKITHFIGGQSAHATLFYLSTTLQQ